MMLLCDRASYWHGTLSYQSSGVGWSCKSSACVGETDAEWRLEDTSS
ncbi:MAG TPA: hypothetical protein V6D11_13845 [Waterburya sp.]